MNFLPLCTAMVCPTMSGCTVERRDQVRSTFFSLRLFMSSIFVIRCVSMNGPFFVLRAIRYSFSRLLAAAVHNELVRALVVARLVATGRLAPWSHRVPATGGLAFTATVRMVDRVHRHTAVGRSDSHPTLTTGLADRDILVVHIRDLTDGRHARHQYPAGLARRQFDQGIVAFLGDQLRRATGRAHHLRTFTWLQLDVV